MIVDFLKRFKKIGIFFTDFSRFQFINQNLMNGGVNQIQIFISTHDSNVQGTEF